MVPGISIGASRPSHKRGSPFPPTGPDHLWLDGTPVNMTALDRFWANGYPVGGFRDVLYIDMSSTSLNLFQLYDDASNAYEHGYVCQRPLY